MSIGSLVILATSAESEESGMVRSTMWVAPRDLRYSSCRFDAVVIMGEKPDILANWITRSEVSEDEQ